MKKVLVLAILALSYNPEANAQSKRVEFKTLDGYTIRSNVEVGKGLN
jgi:hypothetical protein